MADSMDKLSPEQIKTLSKVLSEAGSLIDRQAELIDKLIAGEVDIGKTRIAYLEQYFDTYSKNLDAIARKQSKLNDGVLVLEKKLEKASESAEKTASDIGSTSDIDGDKLAAELAERVAEKLTKTSKSKKSGYPLAELKPEQELSEGAEKAGSAIDPEVREALQKAGEKETSAPDKRADVIAYLINLSDEYYKTIQEHENDIEKTRGIHDIIAIQRDEARKERYEELVEEQELVEKRRARLYNLQHQDEVDKENLITQIRLKNTATVLDAESRAQDQINKYNASTEYSSKYAEEAGELRAREADAEDTAKSLDELEQRRIKYRAELEYKARKKHNGQLTKEDAIEIEKKVAKQSKLEEDSIKKLTKKRFEEEQKARGKENRSKVTAAVSGELSQENNLLSRLKTLNNMGRDEETGERSLRDGLLVATAAISDLAKQLENKIDTIAGKKSAIDTRLQGSNNEKWAGSYWDQLVHDMTSVGAVNPFFKQEDFAKNIETLVAKGISFDLKQRAFLMTISDKIADTFKVNSDTLLRLVRIQQEDSTAGRLGMESALNAFLNNMYETSEYLEGVADSVKTSLEEMESLMKGAEATEVEWQVQKWLGSLYSVGMSSNAVQGISGALGQIAAGQIEGLNGGAGNLLIMAANDAGLSIADILTDGINAKDTNKLLQAAVNYLAELADSAKDNKVVQQQLADVFGVKASDLRAATNLVLPGSTSSIAGYNLTYGNMLSQLSKMAGSMGQRTSIAEQMTNIWENGSYTLAGSMASNPVSYFIYKMAKVVDSAAGGIDLPFLNVMGFGVDLNTTVSDLMRVAAVGAGILGSIGPMISGLGSSFSGQSMLRKLGISSGSGLAITPRGSGSGALTGGGSTSKSESGYAGNSSGSDIKDSTIQEAEDSKKKQMIEAKEEEEANKVDVLNQMVIKIYELLDDVANGKSSFKVKMEGYGLVSNKKNSGSSLGGVAGLEDMSTDSLGSSSVANSSSNSGGLGGSSASGGLSSGLEGQGNTSLSFGGWAVTV